MFTPASTRGHTPGVRPLGSLVVGTKGKPLNVWDLKRDIVYKNDKMYNLMRARDIQDNIERLHYDKVILATDADLDPVVTVE